MSFFVFCRCCSRNRQIQSHKLTDSVHDILTLFCIHSLYLFRDQIGIIGTGGVFCPVMYRMKLQDIKDKKFHFNEVSDKENAEAVWGRHAGYQNQQYLMLNYMADQDKIFGVQCRQEHGKSMDLKSPAKVKVSTNQCFCCTTE